MASNLSKTMGATLTSRQIVKGRVQDLLVNHQVAPVQVYVIVYLDSKDELINYSTTAQNNLLQKCEFDAELLPKTLGYLHKLCDQFRRKIQTPMTRQIVQPTDPATGRIEVLERNKEELDRLQLQVEKDIKQYTVRSICKALTTAMKKAWMSGGMLQQYLAQTKDVDNKLLAQQLLPFLPQQAATVTPQQKPNNPRPRPRPNNTRRPQTQTKTPKVVIPKRSQTQSQSRRSQGRSRDGGPNPNQDPIKLWSRKQQPKAIPSRNDAKLGSRISFTMLKQIKGCCNNFQVWDECALYKNDPTSCTYKHHCSLCFSPLHGRRNCPRLAAPEDPNV